MAAMKLTLPKKNNLTKTTWEDSFDLYYTPFVRYVYLHRFKMAAELIGKKRYNSLLDIGFGCGIFLKELHTHAVSLYGIDLHDNIDEVLRMAHNENFSAELRKGSILAIPYGLGSFDCVVSMSVLEHLTDLDNAMREIRRIACHNADIILGFPVRNFSTNTFFRALGYDPCNIHPSGHNDILRVIKKHFKIIDMVRFPKYFPVDLGLYVVVKCRK